jgi:hypothetical protein
MIIKATKKTPILTLTPSITPMIIFRRPTVKKDINRRILRLKNGTINIAKICETGSTIAMKSNVFLAVTNDPSSIMPNITSKIGIPKVVTA